MRTAIVDESLAPAGLLKVPKLLVGLGSETVRRILAAAKPRKAAPKHLIFWAGMDATHLYLIKTGTVKYFRLEESGAEVLLSWLLPGDVFGLGTLLKNPMPYVGSAEAVSQCELLVWQHEAIRKLAQGNPQIAENSLTILLELLRAFADRHAGLVSRNAKQRLADSLLSLGHRSGRVYSTGVDIHITNQQLRPGEHKSLYRLPPASHMETDGRRLERTRQNRHPRPRSASYRLIHLRAKPWGRRKLNKRSTELLFRSFTRTTNSVRSTLDPNRFENTGDLRTYAGA
jgi:CRP-like cAMP-binding protein